MLAGAHRSNRLLYSKLLSTHVSHTSKEWLKIPSRIWRVSRAHYFLRDHQQLALLGLQFDVEYPAEDLYQSAFLLLEKRRDDFIIYFIFLLMVFMSTGRENSKTA